MQIADLILEYLKVFMSWQVVVLLLGLIFKTPFSNFLQRLVKGEAYGVRVEASTPSEQRKEVKESSVKFQTEDAIIKYVKDNPEEVIKEFRRTINGYWFERAYNLIYGSQIELLEHLSEKGTKGNNYIESEF